MSKLSRNTAALAAIGMWCGLAVAAPAEPVPPAETESTQAVAQYDDFAFPGRDYVPALFPVEAAQAGDGEYGELDDFAFPGRDYMPLLWPPTPIGDDSAFPGKDAGTS